MNRAGGSDDPLYDTAREIAAAAGALADVWEHASQSTPPRLSTLQLRALLAVGGSPRINLTRLAEEVGATAPAASRLCDRLEAAGLLRRERAFMDRREIVLSLTQHGREVIELLAERRCRAVYEVLKHVPAEQREELLNGLRAFTQAADSATTPSEH